MRRLAAFVTCFDDWSDRTEMNHQEIVNRLIFVVMLESCQAVHVLASHGQTSIYLPLPAGLINQCKHRQQ